MKVYLAGPMTGIPQFNFPAFDHAAAMLRRDGFDVVSPAELDDAADRKAALSSPDGSALSYGTGVKKTWGEFLARDVRLIADNGIRGIIVLPGWESSRGARLETYVGAALCGLEVYSITINGSDILLDRVSRITLYRAWCADKHIVIGTPGFVTEEYA